MGDESDGKGHPLFQERSQELEDALGRTRQLQSQIRLTKRETHSTRTNSLGQYSWTSPICASDLHLHCNIPKPSTLTNFLTVTSLRQSNRSTGHLQAEKSTPNRSTIDQNPASTRAHPTRQERRPALAKARSDSVSRNQSTRLSDRVACASPSRRAMDCRATGRLVVWIVIPVTADPARYERRLGLSEDPSDRESNDRGSPLRPTACELPMHQAPKDRAGRDCWCARDQADVDRKASANVPRGPGETSGESAAPSRWRGRGYDHWTGMRRRQLTG